MSLPSPLRRLVRHTLHAGTIATLLAACGGNGPETPASTATATTTASLRMENVTTAAQATQVRGGSRVMENLGRGVVALRKPYGSVLVSWRLLGLDPADIAFNVYRAADGAAPVKLNAEPLTAGTNYDDQTPNLAVANTYTVRPVLAGVEGEASGGFTLKANNPIEPVVRIPLSALPGENYTTKYVWVGDLDGDGEYDYVLDRLAPFRADNDDYGLGNQYLEAYKRDGTRLWQIDLGPQSTYTYNISPGQTTISMGMYDGVTVYDLDGDGKAEVILKVADGVTFGDGTKFSHADIGQQFVAVINGLTGAPLATHIFPNNFYAKAGRLGTQLGIGYPDGVNPSIYFWGRNRNADKSFNDVFASWSWQGGNTIKENWVLPLSGGTTASHQMRIIDLDGDGKDEMASGNFAINSDGTLRYVLPGVGHGDRFYLGKMDPASPDIQGYGIQQDNPSGLLEYYYNATTGVIQWTNNTAKGNLIDVGRGMAADIDAAHPGFETWAFYGVYNGPTHALTQPSTGLYPWPSQVAWWDADVLSENVNDAAIDKWWVPGGAAGRVLTMYKTGAYGYGHNPLFIGDILGDWRTELVYLAKNGTELQIFSTDIPTTVRAYTMAHNPAYRNHMTLKGYMQSPMLDYYFGDGMGTPPVPKIRYAGSGNIQAETAVMTGGVSVKADHSGFYGTGFTDFPTNNGKLEFKHLNGAGGGTRAMGIRYANGSTSARTGVLTINGVAQSITFPSTGGWGRWATLTVSLPLASGTANTLTLASNGQGLANIDELVVP